MHACIQNERESLEREREREREREFDHTVNTKRNIQKHTIPNKSTKNQRKSLPKKRKNKLKIPQKQTHYH
jgi:hypothetical protein